MKKHDEVLKIERTKRKSTSFYGNPSYWLYFEDGRVGYTATNASCGYGAQNYEGKKARVRYHYTARGSMIIDYIDRFEK